MPKFEITTYVEFTNKYFVEAETEEQAVDKVLDSIDMVSEESRVDYLSFADNEEITEVQVITLDEESWRQEKFDEGFN